MRLKTISGLVELVLESDIDFLEVSGLFSSIKISHFQRENLVLEEKQRIKIEYPSCTELRSEYIGKFYWTESKKGRPLVRKGAYIHRGEVLGYIDTLGVMAEIRSEYNCVLRKVFVKRKGKVEYGTLLFGIEVNELRNP